MHASPRSRRWLLLPALGLLGLAGLAARDNFLGAAAPPAPIADYLLQPDYHLPGAAAQQIGPRIPLPLTPTDAPTLVTPPLRLFGEQPTDRRQLPIDPKALALNQFTAELWVLDHSDVPVGLMLGQRDPNHRPVWLLTYRDRAAGVQLFPPGEPVGIKSPRGKWRSAANDYWRHLVVTGNGREVRLYVNGQLVGETKLPNDLEQPGGYLELAAYTQQDTRMMLPNLAQRVRLWDQPLSAGQIKEQFAQLAELVEQGILYPDMFHFTAGPALTYVSPTSAKIVFETAPAATAGGVVEFGETQPFEQSVTFEGDPEKRIHPITLTDLKPRTRYYYKVTARQDETRSIDSGVLTFQTAAEPGQSITFAVIGDTESRPFVNDVLCKRIWQERPDFAVHLGDMTDGGMRDQKPEWTHEYFTGMTQLQSRIPIFAVPGNGEGDLYWFRQYIAVPLDQNNDGGFYRFRYGDAEFFMLDSNRRTNGFAPGGQQYTWLDQALAASTAKWKFVCHHHPVYTCDENDYGDTWQGKAAFDGDPRLRPMITLYEKHKVDVVMYGHIHSYLRTLPIRNDRVDRSGVIYLQSGGAGGNLEDFQPTRTWFQAKTYSDYHYCLLSIVDDQLTIRMHDIDGNLRDQAMKRK